MHSSNNKPHRIYWERTSYRPLEARPFSDDELPFFNKLYVQLTRPAVDPTMTWATEVEVTRQQQYLAAASQRWNVLLSPAHVLTKAVAQALEEHPHFNRRVVGRRVFAFRDINVMMSFQNRQRNEADVLFLKSVDRLSLREVAETVWGEINRARRGEWPLDRAKQRLQRFGWGPLGLLMRTSRWFANRLNLPAGGSRLSRFAASPVLINCLNFPGAPPLRFYKATQLGLNSWTVHVALGPVEPRPVAEGDRVVVRPMMVLIVRIDHRLGDAVELGRFTETISRYFTDPARLERTSGGSDLDGAGTEAGDEQGERPVSFKDGLAASGSETAGVKAAAWAEGARRSAGEAD